MFSSQNGLPGTLQVTASSPYFRQGTLGKQTLLFGQPDKISRRHLLGQLTQRRQSPGGFRQEKDAKTMQAGNVEYFFIALILEGVKIPLIIKDLLANI